MDTLCSNSGIISDDERQAGVICKTDAIETIFIDRAGNLLLVTFNEMGLVANGRDYWAATAAAKLGISVVGFVTRGPNWFPRNHMMICINAALQVIQGRKFQVVLFGLSQGGYAAIKYGALLGAAASICFSPQVSIDPEDIVDKRFNKYFRSDCNAGMAVTADDIMRNMFLFYDPLEAKDAEHCQRIKSLAPGPNCHEFLMPYAGHSTAKPFAGSLYLRRLLDVCLTHDMVGLRALYKEVKPRSPSRPFLIATAAMQRHPGVALRIIEQKSHLTSSLPWDNLRARILDKYDPATASHSPALQPCKKLRA